SSSTRRILVFSVIPSSVIYDIREKLCLGNMKFNFYTYLQSFPECDSEFVFAANSILRFLSFIGAISLLKMLISTIISIVVAG
ncbi:MAG: hypothetical protein QNJ58_19055, partial [Desulfobacterales bacterium]|nr:hypothetical protein [Desulfobacterales bacterium]